MLAFFKTALEFMGQNALVLGLCSILGIVGFVITVFTYLRTAKISKILKYNSVTSQYNKERTAFQKAFEGHARSIGEDGIRSDMLLKDILKNVEAYSFKFGEILPLSERFLLWRFKSILQKEAQNVDFNKVCNYLAKLSGRLSKKEEMKNG